MLTMTIEDNSLSLYCMLYVARSAITATAEFL